MRTLEVAEIGGEQSLADLSHEWNALAAAGSTSGVFLRHEWFMAAWAWRVRDSRLALLAAREASRVVGLLPLIRGTAKSRGARRLEFLTVPDTQFADMIVAPSDAAQVADAFARTLAARPDWDVALFDYLPARSNVVTMLVPAMRDRGLAAVVVERGINPCIALEGGFEAYYAGRSRRLKKAVNLAANRLQKSGTIDIECIAGPSIDDETFDRAIEALVEISSGSWKSRTGTTLDNPGPGAFLRTLCGLARERGWLSVWLLHRDGRPMASELQIVYDGAVHALRADFASGTDELSPGTHLFRKLLEALFGRGLRRYYLGPGDNDYKMRWTDEGEPMQRVWVYNRTWRGKLERGIEHALKPAVRAVRARFRPQPSQPGKGAPDRGMTAP